MDKYRKVFSPIEEKFNLIGSRIALSDELKVVNKNLDSLYDNYESLICKIRASKVVQGMGYATGIIAGLPLLPSAEPHFNYDGVDLSTPQGKALLTVTALGFTAGIISSLYKKSKYKEYDEVYSDITEKEEDADFLEKQLAEVSRKEDLLEVAEACFGKEPVVIEKNGKDYSVTPATEEDIAQAYYNKNGGEEQADMFFAIPTIRGGISAGTEIITPNFPRYDESLDVSSQEGNISSSEGSNIIDFRKYQEQASQDDDFPVQ